MPICSKQGNELSWILIVLFKSNQICLKEKFKWTYEIIFQTIVQIILSKTKTSYNTDNDIKQL